MTYINNNKIKGLGGIKRAYLNNTLIFQSFKKNEEVVSPYDITAKFNVTSTTSPTQLCYSSATSAFTEMYVDDVQIDVSSGYTFNTIGEHNVQYMLSDKTTIGNEAFSGCSNLISIVIEDSVKVIGRESFHSCKSLTEIVIPESVTNIGYYAFSSCISLNSIVIPDSVGFIGNGCFYKCSGLTSVTIGSGVTSIGLVAFKGCTKLTSIIIPNSVEDIGSSTFNDCSGLTSVTIGIGVTSIGDYAFDGCSRLTEITCLPTTAPTLGTDIFVNLPSQGTLYIPQGSDYSTWKAILTTWNVQYLT